MENGTATTPTGASFVYRLTLGSLISEEKSEKLTLEQGVSNLFADEEKDVAYYVVLLGFKMIKRIYQPTEIVAVFDITQSITDTSGKKVTTVPPFEDVTETLLRRRVKLEFAPVSTANNSDRASVYTIAENCYIHEVEPQLLRDVNGTKMCVKLHIFSMDKLMTLNQYSKAYVARKLGSGILKPESLSFGKLEKTGEPLVKTNIKGLRFLKYDEQVVVPGTNDEQTTMNIPSEFIQPYLVQYNESFYDFLVRTSNRCGEFLFFENGELTLGLPDSGDPVVIDNFLSVTQRSTSPAPLDIKAYTRDSMKDGNGQLKDLNQTVINKLSTGYPEDAFPANTSSNAELANDEYIFPLYKDKFSKLKRENYYDRPAFKALNSIKALTTGTDMVASIVGLGIAEGLLVMSGNSQTNNTNQQKGEHYPQQELREGHQRYADDFPEHEFTGLDGAHKDLHHTGALLFNDGTHDHAGEQGDEHIDGNAQDHGETHVDAAFGDALLTAFVNGIAMELYIGLHARHDLLQILNTIGFNTVRLHRVIDPTFDHGTGIHAQGLLAVAVGRYGPSQGVQFGDGEEHVHAGCTEIGLDGLRGGIGAQILEKGHVIALQIRQDNAGAVYDAHLLGLFLGVHHDDGGKDADGRKENGGQERDKEETLLLYLVKVFTLDNDS